jgi:RNA polymerase sigma factor (sigma-70 family)
MSDFEDTFAQYANSLSSSRYAPLDYKTERALILEYKASGSEKAFKRLTEAHLRFVVGLLRSYKIPTSLDIMDVIQEGNEGLMKGIQMFDPIKFDCRVFSYGMFWVRVKIDRFLDFYFKEHRLVPTITSLETSEHENVIENEVDPDENEEVGLSPETRRKILDDIMGHGKGLSDREIAVLKLSWGLTSAGIPKTLEEIGSMLHLHLERVRQVKLAALNKLDIEGMEKRVFGS